MKPLLPMHWHILVLLAHYLAREHLTMIWRMCYLWWCWTNMAVIHKRINGWPYIYTHNHNWNIIVIEYITTTPRSWGSGIWTYQMRKLKAHKSPSPPSVMQHSHSAWVSQSLPTLNHATLTIFLSLPAPPHPQSCNTHNISESPGPSPPSIMQHSSRVSWPTLYLHGAWAIRSSHVEE